MKQAELGTPVPEAGHLVDTNREYSYHVIPKNVKPQC